MADAPRPPLVLHVDMDCFYVSVERLLDPSLNGLPVAVGGTPDGRGVVSSASYEARAFGVRSAMPMGQALRLCPRLVVVSGSYARYREFSNQVAEVFSRYSPIVRMASQDEAYLDLSGTGRLYGSPLNAADQLRRDVLAVTQLPCSLGLGANRLIAKIASDLCKPRGLLWIPNGSEERFMAPLPVGRIPGVGKKTEERLKEVGVTRVRDIGALGEARLIALFGSWGADLWERAHGRAEGTLQAHEPARSIGAEETLDRDSTDGAQLDRLLSALCEKVAFRLREERVLCTQVSLKYRYGDFETHTAQETMPYPMDDEMLMLDTVRRLFSSRWDGRRPIRLLGVTLAQLAESEGQLDLLAAPARPQESRLHKAIDAIRSKHGFERIQRGSSSE